MEGESIQDEQDELDEDHHTEDRLRNEPSLVELSKIKEIITEDVKDFSVVEDNQHKKVLLIKDESGRKNIRQYLLKRLIV